MAAINAPWQSNALPSISQLDFDKVKADRPEYRYSSMPGLNISTAPLGSPTNFYPGPPPPYTSAPSNNDSVHPTTGYISPPESNSRRSTRDEKESPAARTSLPSISEALGDKSMSFPTSVISTTQSTPSLAAPIGQPFPDGGPKGPPNPFSQPLPPATTPRESQASSHVPSFAQATRDVAVSKPPTLSTHPSDLRHTASRLYAYPSSPRSAATEASQRAPMGPPPDPVTRSPRPFEPPRSAFTFSPYHGQSGSSFPYPADGQPVDGPVKHEDRAPYVRSVNNMPYGETVKRHLDVFDIELALNEITEISSRTSEFSRTWLHRYHQNNKASYFNEALPEVGEVDEMLRQSHHMLENFDRIRAVIVAQQQALTEERARLARGSTVQDDFANMGDEYKSGGFAGGDAKKRRGKAAPPGRCHSCNRAETPEWRRGPDGARTLCNACGLHYAKLTRKMGVSKASQLTGSNLRPKNLDPRSPHM